MNSSKRRTETTKAVAVFLYSPKAPSPEHPDHSLPCSSTPASMQAGRFACFAFVGLMLPSLDHTLTRSCLPEAWPGSPQPCLSHEQSVYINNPDSESWGHSCHAYDLAFHVDFLGAELVSLAPANQCRMTRGGLARQTCPSAEPQGLPPHPPRAGPAPRVTGLGLAPLWKPVNLGR